MSVRIKKYSRNGIEKTEVTGQETIDQNQIIDNEGYAYHVGLNAHINFLDDGRGISAANSALSGSNIVQDTIPYGSSRS